MAAFYTLALALAPRFVQHLVHHNGARPVQASPRAAAAQSTPTPRHRTLSCHWERGGDGSLVAHWLPDGKVPARGSLQACPFGMLRDVPRALIDDAYHFERHGSVLSLIAMSRMARMSTHARRFGTEVETPK
jgi:hypothetical protein